MGWDVIKEFIRPELFILVAFLWVIGFFLKKWPQFKAEYMIPTILWVVGVIIAILYIAVVLGEGWTAAVIIAAIIQGTLIAGMAVGGNELIKQQTKKKSIDLFNR